jgi:periplasmic protein TonB
MTRTFSALDYPIDPRTTRRDLAVGLVFSLCSLIGLCWISQVLKQGPHRPTLKDAIPSVQMVLPKIEPDPPEVDDLQPQVTSAEIAPPMQTDVPQIVRADTIVQPLEPPPPTGMVVDRRLATVPADIGPSNGGKIFDPSTLDQQPVATYQESPLYPYDMKKAGITGMVVVDFILEPDGRVSHAYAASATQHGFESSAVQAVQKWKFRPGRRAGRPVRTHMSVPITFSLESN